MLYSQSLRAYFILVMIIVDTRSMLQPRSMVYKMVHLMEWVIILWIALPELGFQITDLANWKIEIIFQK